MKNWLLLVIFFQIHENLLADYTKPVTAFKQMVNGDEYGNRYLRQFISNDENTIQLSWDYVHYYHDYELEWWTYEDSFQRRIPKTRVSIGFTELARDIFDVDYYSFVHTDPNVFVYFIQIRGWLYGRGYGEKSKILKCLKPYKGQPFPVTGLRQSYNNTPVIRVQWDLTSNNDSTSIHYYKIVYCLLDNCHNTIREIAVEKDISNVQLDIVAPLKMSDEYKVLVYGATNNGTVKNEIAKRQATLVIARPWFIGQPSELKNVTQMQSRFSNSISLCWLNPINRDPLGHSFIRGFKFEVFSVSGSRINVSDSVIRNEGLRIFCEIFGLPNKRNEVYDVDVFSYNFHGDGYKVRKRVVPDAEILVGLPDKVKELMVWTSGALRKAISVRWLRLTPSQTGFEKLKGYNITWHKTGDERKAWSTFFIDLWPRAGYKIYTISDVIRWYDSKFWDGMVHTFTVSVSGCTASGCGPKSFLYNVRTDVTINVKPSKPSRFHQLPNSNPKQITLAWYASESYSPLLPVLGYWIQVRQRGCAPQMEKVQARAGFNTKVVTISCSLLNRHALPFFNMSLELNAFNSYTVGPFVRLTAKTSYIGLSAPVDVHFITCQRIMQLTWVDVTENRTGYCISHRSTRDNLWNLCCLPVPPVAPVGHVVGQQGGNKYKPTLLLNTNGYVTFTQTLKERPTFTAAVGLCSAPVYGDVQFKVNAYNDLGSGYAVTTKYTRCGVMKDSDETKNNKNKSTITIILVLAASLIVIIIGVFVWRFKKLRLALNRGNTARQQQQQQQPPVTSEQEMLVFTPSTKLPTYEEAVRDTPDGPPPTFEEAVSLTSREV